MSVYPDFLVAQPPWLELEQFIPMMGDDNHDALQRLLCDHRKLFMVAPGSSSNHQSWVGGYWDHITECLNFASMYFALWTTLRSRPYELWEALEVLFVHDLEKPWRFTPNLPCVIPVPDLTEKSERATFRLALLEHYGIRFTADQDNAMRYCEGELGDYTADHRTMRPLAHLCHTCDETSARQFFEYPAADQDTWQGARRITARG